MIELLNKLIKLGDTAKKPVWRSVIQMQEQQLLYAIRWFSLHGKVYDMSPYKKKHSKILKKINIIYFLTFPNNVVLASVKKRR